MLDTLLTINWNPDPTLFHLFGFPIRYYSLLWIVGIACSYFIVRREYRDLKIGDDKFDPLFFYCFIGILVGCRLGHCLFYQPEYYLSGVKPFIEMFVPIKFLPDGDWKWTGYEGLASHGGTLGLMIALWLYCRKTKMHFMDVLDIIAVATPICACCIRLANLMNSEILLHLLPGHAISLPPRPEATEGQNRRHEARSRCSPARRLPPPPRLLLRVVPDGDIRIPLLRGVPEGGPGGL